MQEATAAGLGSGLRVGRRLGVQSGAWKQRRGEGLGGATACWDLGGSMKRSSSGQARLLQSDLALGLGALAS